MSPFFLGKKERLFVASILDTLLKNSSSSHKGYLCKAAKVSALLGYLPSKCQLWNLYCGGHGGRLRSPTLLMNHRSLLLCTRVATFPTLCLPCSLERSLFPHIWAECSVVCQEARLAECWFHGSHTREANSNFLSNLHKKWPCKT